MADEPTLDDLFPESPPTRPIEPRSAVPTTPVAGTPADDGALPTRRELREREAAAAAAGVPVEPVASAQPASEQASAPYFGATDSAPSTPAAPDAPYFGASDVAPAVGVPAASSASGATPPKPPKPSRKKRSDDSDDYGYAKPPRRGRWIVAAVVIAFFGAIGGVAAYGWANYEDQIRAILNIELPNDYEGTGNGEAVTVTVVSGDVGGVIADKLEEAGVTMTSEAFYDLVVEQPTAPVFMPGTFTLQKEMSAQSALDVLVNPANIVVSRVLVREGVTLPQALSALSEGTGVPLADFEAVAADFTSLGVPAEAPSLEGFLFPATYDFEPGATAQQILQTMVDRMYQSLDGAGVQPQDRLSVLTLASIVQKEGGSTEDFYIVSRLFQNRMAEDPPMKLESDATVSYGAGSTSIHTTDEQRLDASNPYNTYANPGLPVGPISAPGDDAIDATLNPAEGDWLYMVLINGETGETAFNVTFEDHLEDVAVWQAWYRAHPGWDN